MARPLRVHLIGGFYHVTLRGNHRQPIFFADADRATLDNIVVEAAHHLCARVHAYCWMTNHIHALIQVAEAPLEKIMHRIASRYARKVQSRLDTTGHLFERRYHATLVDADRYLLHLIRYIHLNPVRAAIVAEPGAYPWSSHRTYLGEHVQPWVTTRFALGLLHSDPAQAVRRYREFTASQEPCRWGSGYLAPNHADARMLGDDAFVARALGRACRARSPKSLEDLVAECYQRFGLEHGLLESPSRARRLTTARAWVAHEAVSGRVASVCEVARRLRRTESAVRQVMLRHPLGVGPQ